MDNNSMDRAADHADEVESNEEATPVDRTSANIIGANLLSSNTASFAGGVVAPAATAGAEEAEDADDGMIDLDALDRFSSANRGTGHAGVSSDQSEIEADELNG